MDRITVSTAVDTEFELHCLREASQLLSSMLESYPTSMEHDLYLLDVISQGDNFVPKTEEAHQAFKTLSQKRNKWHFKLALIHRVNQKEILHNQLKYILILQTILTRAKRLQDSASQEGSVPKLEDFRKLYFQPVLWDQKTAQIIVRHRIVLRYYLQEYVQN